MGRQAALLGHPWLSDVHHSSLPSLPMSHSGRSQPHELQGHLSKKGLGWMAAEKSLSSSEVDSRLQSNGDGGEQALDKDDPPWGAGIGSDPCP